MPLHLPLPDDFDRLFVGRAPILLDIELWATQFNRRARLRKIQAPPDYGKSWLLRRAFQRLSQIPGLYPIWADAQRLLREAEFNDWLQSEIDLVRQQKDCAQIRAYDPTVTTMQMLQAFLNDLWHVCGTPLRPILITDALDEISQEQVWDIEKRLLEPFAQNTANGFEPKRKESKSAEQFTFALFDSLRFKSPIVFPSLLITRANASG